MENPVKNTSAESLPCPICSDLGEVSWASQKYGWEENDTFLPEASQKLVVIRDMKPDSARALQLWQCPVCTSYFLYESDYEYLVNGSEDEQCLKRLSVEEAEIYLNPPKG